MRVLLACLPLMRRSIMGIQTEEYSYTDEERARG